MGAVAEPASGGGRGRVPLLIACALVLALAAAAAAAPGDLRFERCVDDTFGPEDCGRSGKALNGANAVVLSPDGASAYVASVFSDAVTHLKVNQAEGRLRPVNRHCVDNVGGADPCPRQAPGLLTVASLTVSPDEKFVYATGGNGSTVTVLERDGDTGSLRSRGCIEDDDGGFDVCGREAPGMLGANHIVISPDGRFAYVAAGTDDAIAILKRNQQTGKLRAFDCVEDGERSVGPDSSGCGRAAGGLNGVAEVALGRGSRSLYYAGALDDTVGRMGRTRDNGRLKPRECVADENTGTGGCTLEMQGLDGPGQLALDSERRFLYAGAGSGFEHSIALLRLRRRAGVLRPVQCVADADNGPPAGCPRTADGLEVVSALVISPDDRFLYAQSSLDDAIVTLRRDRDNGRLTDRGCIADDDAPAPGGDCDREADTLNGGGSLQITANGRWLLAVSQIEDAVSVFKRRR